MKRNDTFCQMLQDYHPDFGNNDQYIKQLSDKLEQIETVKQIYDTERRTWRSRLVVALVSGGMAGVLSTVYFILHPIRPAFRLWFFHLGSASMHLERTVPFATPFLIALFTVSAAVVATLLYRIVKKDFAA